MQSTCENNHTKFCSKISSDFWEIVVYIRNDFFSTCERETVFDNATAESIIVCFVEFQTNSAVLKSISHSSHWNLLESSIPVPYAERFLRRPVHFMITRKYIPMLSHILVSIVINRSGLRLFWFSTGEFILEKSRFPAKFVIDALHILDLWLHIWYHTGKRGLMSVQHVMLDFLPRDTSTDILKFTLMYGCISVHSVKKDLKL